MLGQAAQATISYLKLPQGNTCFPDVVDKVVISRIYLCQITIIYLAAVIFTYERKGSRLNLLIKLRRVSASCVTATLDPIM